MAEMTPAEFAARRADRQNFRRNQKGNVRLTKERLKKSRTERMKGEKVLVYSESVTPPVENARQNAGK